MVTCPAPDEPIPDTFVTARPATPPPTVFGLGGAGQVVTLSDPFPAEQPATDLDELVGSSGGTIRDPLDELFEPVEPVPPLAPALTGSGADACADGTAC
jgi:hypothetical protein